MAHKRLPKEVFSIHGNMPLERTSEGLDDEDFGAFSPNPRKIVVHPDVTPENEWPTYFHEISHVALFDSGVTQVLEKKQEEAVCEAIGNYLAAMQRAGMLDVKTPRKKSPLTTL